MNVIIDDIYVNPANVSRIEFHKELKCDWFKWAEKRVKKKFNWKNFSFVRKLKTPEGFYDARLNPDPPKYLYDSFGDKQIFLLNELGAGKHPYWCKFSYRYALKYEDSEIFIKPHIEFYLVGEETPLRLWFDTDEEMFNYKKRLFDYAQNKEIVR